MQKIDNELPVICWFSAGVTSAVATKIAVQYYSNVRIIFIGTGQEEHDSFRFIEDCEDWFCHDIETFKSPKYVDAFDVFEKTKYLAGPSGARCTLELKKKVRYMIEDTLGDWCRQVFGFDASEDKRAKRFDEQYPKAKAWFPLIMRQLSKADCMAIIERAGIELPLMYRLGFPNNNCIGCVKGGKGYWNKIRREFPDVFKRMALLERQIGHSCINGCFLDELEDDKGRLPVIVPSCSLYCDPEFINL